MENTVIPKFKETFLRNIGCVKVEGNFYFTVNQFVKTTGRSESTIRSLISVGNTARKLRCLKIENKVLIPWSELEEFPFIQAGRNVGDIKLMDKFEINEDGTLTCKEKLYEK